MLGTGAINHSDMVWSMGMKDWTPVGTLLGLPQPPAPPAPPPTAKVVPRTSPQHSTPQPPTLPSPGGIGRVAYLLSTIGVAFLIGVIAAAIR